jgi:protoheme IX farnesyltransferase
MRQKIKDYIELSKPGILILVLVSTALGFVLAERAATNFYILFITLVGTTVCAAGAGALNHFLERDVDTKMNRTKNRPIPSGRVSAQEAFAYGILCTIFGCTLLAWQVNLLSGFLALMTTFLYALVYTPLKRQTWLNTAIGAIPGALPIMGGWVAATNHLSVEAWILFAIMFTWQHPHFYAIAWMLREDYARGGFKMLPCIEPDGISTFRQIRWFSYLMLLSTLALYCIGAAGLVYAIGSTILGFIMIYYCEQSSRTHQNAAAKTVFRYSILYLPLLFILLALDVGLGIY